MIQGKTVGSLNELYMALALDKYKIPYFYQYVILQKPGIRGAIIVDFVISNPFYIPVEVYGEYWHTGQLGADDKLKLQMEWNYFGREPVVVWAEQDIPDQESAEMYVRQHFV